MLRSHPKDRFIWTKCRDYLLYISESKIWSNEGSCLTHVNIRCLCDCRNELALSVLWADVSGGKSKLELATDLRTWQLLHPSPPRSVLYLSVVNWVQPDMGIRWGGLFISFLPPFWLAFGFADVSRSSHCCHIWSSTNVLLTAKWQQNILLCALISKLLNLFASMMARHI